uniref:Deoxythymidylate kinase n=1 Tax=Molossus molossus TaxID=27622 RepID=A0A7J8FQW2_MOLMO|nr:deoxythymidylate kinase [Molossus molossus]
MANHSALGTTRHVVCFINVSVCIPQRTFSFLNLHLRIYLLIFRERGLLPALVQAAGRGPPQAGPGPVPAAALGRGGGARRVRPGALRGRALPGAGAALLPPAHGGRDPELEDCRRFPKHRRRAPGDPRAG